MAAVDVDVVESALRDVNLSSGRETVLKPEQRISSKGSFSRQRCSGGFADRIRQEFNLPNVCTREELRASERFSQFIER